MDIGTELQAFNITDAAIAELRERYKDLVIKDKDDAVGFKIVHDARMDIVKRRTGVEKIRQELKAGSLEYGRRIDGEAKRLFALLAPIEKHLEEEENRVKEEKARIKREAEEKEAAHIQARVDRLFKLGMTWDGAMYGLVKEANDEQFDMFCEKVAAGVQAEKERLAEERRLADENQARLDKVAADQAAERKRLDDEKAAFESEKKKIKDKEDAGAAEIKRLAELKEAGERAVAEEAKNKEIRDKKEADKKKRAEARRPDKEKLESLGLAMVAVPFPDMKSEEGQDVLDWFGPELMKLVKELKKKTEAL